MAETATGMSAMASEPSTRDRGWHRAHTPRRRTRRLIAFALVSTAVLGACAEAGDDLSPVEPEAGEHDTEVVPGEEGPVE